MKEEVIEPVKRGRGRPSLGETAMTNAERRKKWKERSQAAGYTEFTMRLPAPVLDALDVIALGNNRSRNAIIEHLLTEVLAEVARGQAMKPLPDPRTIRAEVQGVTR